MYRLAEAVLIPTIPVQEIGGLIVERVDEWIGDQGMPGARLVRMQRGETKQSFNFCFSSGVPGEYEYKYDIKVPSRFMSNGEFSGCRSVEALIEKILRYGGEKREG